MRIVSKSDNLHNNTDTISVDNFIVTDEIKVSDRIFLSKSTVFDGLTYLICLRGSGKLKINYREITISANQVMIILPYHIVKKIEQSDEFCIAAIFLGNDFMTNMVNSINLVNAFHFSKNPVATFTEEQVKELMEFHMLILKRYKKLNSPYTMESVSTLIKAFMLEVSSLYRLNRSSLPNYMPSRHEKITEDFFRMLILNFKSQRTVKFYADKLCFTPKYLSSVIKKITGHTIQEWINELVILHAKTLLKTTDMTVLQISEELNFSNPSFFGRFFKQYTGRTPLKFKYAK
ncbi:MAG: AraC family transcriptional regulator [Rikenellaceae bacterium]|nr:AraC family transcriptional regulator [Rikenellaceae bacterium]